MRAVDAADLLKVLLCTVRRDRKITYQILSCKPSYIMAWRLTSSIHGGLWYLIQSTGKNVKMLPK
jgi:hypothetical protein